jgi:uncharacterized membrane-anchored protein
VKFDLTGLQQPVGSGEALKLKRVINLSETKSIVSKSNFRAQVLLVKNVVQVRVIPQELQDSTQKGHHQNLYTQKRGEESRNASVIYRPIHTHTHTHTIYICICSFHCKM